MKRIKQYLRAMPLTELERLVVKERLIGGSHLQGALLFIMMVRMEKEDKLL